MTNVFPFVSYFRLKTISGLWRRLLPFAYPVHTLCGGGHSRKVPQVQRGGGEKRLYTRTSIMAYADDANLDSSILIAMSEELTSKIMHLPIVRVVKKPSLHPLHGRFVDQEHVLELPTSGTCRYTMDGQTWEISRGQVLFMPPRMLHTVEGAEGESHARYVIHFDLYDAGEALTGCAHVFSLNETQYEIIEALFDRAFQEWIKRKLHYETAIAGITAELLALVLRYGRISKPLADQAHPADHQVYRSLEFIRQNYTNPELTIKDMSQEAELSVPHFSRLMKKHLGMSPYRYLNEYRIAVAEGLLLQRRLTCSEISGEIGFSSLFVFSKVFKRLRGVPPSQWQKQ